ncbi:MAG TPA: elongation factor G [Solirubrobacteraceae bacterium]|nr:elongation factor G [Solirubrobacteraceae bacterium]
MHKPADQIRNVALIGHRGSGKTSLHEALLHQAGVTSRLGTVDAGTTVSDVDPAERMRRMSISASLSAFTWMGRRVNLMDTPGEPSFGADTLGALCVCESAIVVVNAVMGVELSTRRLWEHAARLDLARLVFVNMLDRERADFFRTLEKLQEAFGPHVVATEIPIGAEHAVAGIIDLITMRAVTYTPGDTSRENARETEIPGHLTELAQRYREQLMDAVAENSDQLMERYLDGVEIDHDEIIAALKAGTNHGHLFPVMCGIATANLGSAGLLTAIVEDLPSPVTHGGLPTAGGALDPADDAALPPVAYVFKTRADPYAGRLNLFRVFQGVVRRDSQLLNARAHVRERVGQLLQDDGVGHPAHVEEIGPGDIGAVAKLKETRSGDWLTAGDAQPGMATLVLPRPVSAFAVRLAGGGGAERGRGHGEADDDKLSAALRRLLEEDPALEVHRDPDTGEQIIAGLSALHVEVTVERLAERFGIQVALSPPRVPYRETIRRSARAHGRHKKQTGGRGQFGDCHISIAPLEPVSESAGGFPAGAGGEATPASGDGWGDGGFEFVNAIRGGAIPASFIPAVERGVREAMDAGPVAGCPVRGVRVTLEDGAFHSVDSSEMAFRLAGALAMREAMAQADPVLLEPIMLVTVTVPEAAVGEVMGDLSGRRGRPLGMTPAGPLMAITAEIPLAELSTYASDLRALTGGQGEYAVEFLRYEPVPDHLAGTIVAATGTSEPHGAGSARHSRV